MTSVKVTNDNFLWIIGIVGAVGLVAVAGLGTLAYYANEDSNEKSDKKIQSTIEKIKKAVKTETKEKENECILNSTSLFPYLDLTGRWRVDETSEFMVIDHPTNGGIFELVFGSPFVPDKSIRGPYVGQFNKENASEIHLFIDDVEWTGAVKDQDTIVFTNNVDPTRRTLVRESISPLPENP